MAIPFTLPALATATIPVVAGIFLENIFLSDVDGRPKRRSETVLTEPSHMLIQYNYDKLCGKPFDMFDGLTMTMINSTAARFKTDYFDVVGHAETHQVRFLAPTLSK